MSKTGQELEKKLDENEYEMYRRLGYIFDELIALESQINYLQNEITILLAKIEGK